MVQQFSKIAYHIHTRILAGRHDGWKQKLHVKKKAVLSPALDWCPVHVSALLSVFPSETIPTETTGKKSYFFFNWKCPNFIIYMKKPCPYSWHCLSAFTVFLQLDPNTQWLTVLKHFILSCLFIPKIRISPSHPPLSCIPDGLDSICSHIEDYSSHTPGNLVFQDRWRYRPAALNPFWAAQTPVERQKRQLFHQQVTVRNLHVLPMSAWVSSDSSKIPKWGVLVIWNCTFLCLNWSCELMNLVFPGVNITKMYNMAFKFH